MENSNLRYRFYREHKYVSFRLSEFERQVAKTNFGNSQQVDKIVQSLSSLAELMKSHAIHEDKAIHELLRRKSSTLHHSVENEHIHHRNQFRSLENCLVQINESNDNSERIRLGYEFYLSYRLLISEQLSHLHFEETAILPELQRLYTDEELRQVEASTYEQMTSEDMLHMIEVLFDHMDVNDHQAFLSDIKQAQPMKFNALWESIKYMFE